MSTQKHPAPPARLAALEALERTMPVRGGFGADVQAALDQTLNRVEDPRDKRLAAELVYGYLRHKGRLEYVLSTVLSKPGKTQPFVLRVLGLAAYEILFLDHVPAHATLSWAVDCVKAKVGAAAGSMVNGVLRALTRLEDAPKADAFFTADSPSAAVRISRLASAPLWLVESLLRDFGAKTCQDVLLAQLDPAPTGVRVNRLAPGACALFDSLTALPGLLAASFPALAFSPGSQAHSLAGLADLEAKGLVSRQSFAVHKVLSALGCADWPDPVWDACAGRGGKTAYLAEAGHLGLIASDPSLKRLQGLKRERARLGLALPRIFRADATCPPLRDQTRTILVDAPCTGLGVLSRRPDAKWKRSFADVTALAALQRRILHAALALLPAGGRLVYVTCTVTHAENQAQADWLCSQPGVRQTAEVSPDVSDGLGELFYGGVWIKE